LFQLAVTSCDFADWFSSICASPLVICELLINFQVIVGENFFPNHVQDNSHSQFRWSWCFD